MLSRDVPVSPTIYFPAGDCPDIPAGGGTSTNSPSVEKPIMSPGETTFTIAEHAGKDDLPDPEGLKARGGAPDVSTFPLQAGGAAGFSLLAIQSDSVKDFEATDEPKDNSGRDPLSRRILEGIRLEVIPPLDEIDPQAGPQGGAGLLVHGNQQGDGPGQGPNPGDGQGGELGPLRAYYQFLRYLIDRVENEENRGSCWAVYRFLVLCVITTENDLVHLIRYVWTLLGVEIQGWEGIRDEAPEEDVESEEDEDADSDVDSPEDNEADQHEDEEEQEGEAEHNEDEEFPEDDHEYESDEEEGTEADHNDDEETEEEGEEDEDEEIRIAYAVFILHLSGRFVDPEQRQTYGTIAGGLLTGMIIPTEAQMSALIRHMWALQGIVLDHGVAAAAAVNPQAEAGLEAEIEAAVAAEIADQPAEDAEVGGNAETEPQPAAESSVEMGSEAETAAHPPEDNVEVEGSAAETAAHPPEDNVEVEGSAAETAAHPAEGNVEVEGSAAETAAHPAEGNVEVESGATDAAEVAAPAVGSGEEGKEA